VSLYLRLTAFMSYSTNKKALEIFLSKVPMFSEPKEFLEQYMTPSHIAADILWSAYMNNEIKDNVVLDFGCGTGIFTAGSSYLGASYSVCVDIDYEALETARNFLSRAADQPYDLVVADLRSSTPFRRSDCIVLMNPPFGVKSKGADLDFLKNAVMTCCVVYSIHKVSEGFFKVFEKFCRENSLKCDILKIFPYPIKATLSKHVKKVVYVDAVVVKVSLNEKCFKPSPF